MSRIGKQPIDIPAGVEINLGEKTITAKGSRGTLERTIPSGITIAQENGRLLVTRASDMKDHRSLHGLTRALVANMVNGVSQGFEKKLDLVGTGYRASVQNKKLVLVVGYSHPVEITAPEGIEFETPTATKIVVKGIDKEKVGNIAASIREVHKPEPYKGKGIKYENEVIRRKAGKAGKK
ncbi:MAG: 50S ribosomal protein L6 [Syntrophomonadaceae bacterium]|nr:50S ribosomal protein L6 [Syntrophomonadaceae bacterium]